MNGSPELCETTDLSAEPAEAPLAEAGGLYAPSSREMATDGGSERASEREPRAVRLPWASFEITGGRPKRFYL